MEVSFWLEKWEKNHIAFHEGDANALLVRHVESLSLMADSRVFLPLCGKTRDIAWLLSKGYRVIGAELSQSAIEQLFAELGVEPTVSKLAGFKRYSANDIDIFVGDIFELSAAMIGEVDAVYDRAALVALPLEMRQQYSAHLLTLVDSAPQLLISFEYDQSLLPGPPFSVSANEVKQHYQESYSVTLLESIDVPGGLKGKCPAMESIWLLSKWDS